MSNIEPFLTVKNITHTFVNKEGVFHALEQIDLTVNKGEFVTFVGPSGCGKTTLLNIIAGFIQATHGQILIANKPLLAGKEQIGYMQQQDYLFPWRSIYDNILIGYEIRKENKKGAIQRADELLKELGLDNIGHKFPHQLSGGMRQRIALARSLITNPNILLLDEPFSALDMHIKIQLEQLLLTTLKKLNKTAVLVTHDIGEAVAISDTIYIFAKSPGRIVKKIIIDDELKHLDPYESRKHPSYNRYFDEIWEFLNGAEKPRGELNV